MLFCFEKFNQLIAALPSVMLNRELLTFSRARPCIFYVQPIVPGLYVVADFCEIEKHAMLEVLLLNGLSYSTR